VKFGDGPAAVTGTNAATCHWHTTSGRRSK